MRVRLLSIWRSVTSSFWFVPGLMSAAAAVLSVLMITIDEVWRAKNADAIWFVWTGGAEGAREVLSAIASSMIGIAGVTFSILVVALAQASSQFGPRVLRSFMRDTGNQIALGTFIATFLYCVLVLRTVSGADGSEFVPDLSVSLGILLGVCSVAVLIYFLHHAAISIQAPHIVSAIADELDGIIEGQRVEHPADDARSGGTVSTPDLDGPSRSVPSEASGYLEAIDFDALIDRARKHDLVLRLNHRAGEFVYASTELLRACPADRVDDELARALADGFTFKPQKLPAEAIDVGMLQLVEVAVRSLSPSLNDPFTALSCVERLADALLRLQSCPRAGPCRYDAEGRLRVIASTLTNAELIDIAIDPIRHYGRDSALIVHGLLEFIAVLAPGADAASRQALARQAQMIRDAGAEVFREPWDRERIERKATAAEAALARPHNAS